MALMLSKTYAAFKAAGVSEPEASAAAEEIAGYENRLARIESDLRLLKWMVSGIYVMLIPSIWLLLRVAAKVGALA